MSLSPPSLRPARAFAAVVLSGALCVGALGTTTATASAADPVPGARTSGDSLFPHVGNGGYDVLHYDLDIAWTPGASVATDSTIDATAKITAEAKTPLSEFSLDFEGLTVDSITVDGVPATWERDIDPAVTKYKLIVTPAEPVEGDFTTVVEYSGTPVKHIDPDGSPEGWIAGDDGATAVNEPVGAMTWYPVNNSLKDKAKYDIKLTIPRQMDGESMAAASNGTLHAKTRNGALETWHWKQPNQMVPYLSMVSIGKYEVRESVIELESGTYRDWTFLDAAMTTSQRNTTLASLAQTQDIMRWMESNFGPYPGVATGAVVDRINVGYALETQDRSFYQNSVSKNTLIHEIAHQWFGNAVSPTDWSDLWLNEGAGDLAPRYYNYETGAATAVPETTSFNSWNTSSATAAQWRYPLAGFTDPTILFNYVYSRGGMTYEVLRTIVGDETWREILRTWVAENNGSNASTADFMELAQRIAGKDLTSVMNPWLYATSKPAWPSKWNLSVTSDSEGPVAVGETVVHTVTAQNTGKVALGGQTVTIDVADLLDDARLGELPEGVKNLGGKLAWTIPATPAGQSATIAIPAVVKQSSSGGSIAITTSTTALGSFCGTCSVSTATAEQPDAWAVGLSSDPVPGSVDTGDAITYTVSATNRAVHALSGAKATIDLSDVLDDASIVTLGDGLELDGTTLTWSVPRVLSEKTARASFTVEVDAVSGATLALSAAPATAGGTGEPTLTHAVALKPLTPAPVPTVTGAGRVGTVLTAQTGTWPAGTALAYQWSVGGKVVAGATQPSYRLAAKDVGKVVTVAVTGTKSGWAPVAKVSKAVKAAPGRMTRSPRPFQVGLPKVGRTLKVDAGTWDPGTKLTYRWYRGGKPIAGATKKSYKVKKADAGKRLRVKVTAKKPGYTTVVKYTPRSVRVLR
ncbi:M1 family metallopeptidase [Aeromicrobium duanguangcaii]|uniref:M1 family metallopeptidase n=1 Tax=Aeromicrobium duanguangcaii TaxID=2968086 RepID=A0ABY5KE07_9ACTN|nr:M1 family metallopeptidase [Aeromicrobium duanguangcaii]MCD9154243.1 M1 family metallopeptidase [Aeromicrobium duanguangcaii]UUI68686.1 M1 family metallopeptidase [Aeromicrobium duanguangcaii]